MDSITPEIRAIPIPDWCEWEIFYDMPALRLRRGTRQSVGCEYAHFAWINTNNSAHLRYGSYQQYPPFPTTLDACNFIAILAWTLG